MLLARGTWHHHRGMGAAADPADVPCLMLGALPVLHGGRGARGRPVGARPRELPAARSARGRPDRVGDGAHAVPCSPESAEHPVDHWLGLALAHCARTAARGRRRCQPARGEGAAGPGGSLALSLPADAVPARPADLPGVLSDTFETAVTWTGSLPSTSRSSGTRAPGEPCRVSRWFSHVTPTAPPSTTRSRTGRARSGGGALARDEACGQ